MAGHRTFDLVPRLSHIEMGIIVVILQQQLVSSTARVSKGVNPCTTITVHETGNRNKGANAQAHARLQTSGNLGSNSWHEQIDDSVAIRSYKPTQRTWHSGRTVGNNTSYSVELCVNSDGDWAKTISNAVQRLVQLQRELNVPIEKIVQHNYWSGKNCPETLRTGRGWSDLIERVRHPDIIAVPIPQPQVPTPTPQPSTPKPQQVPRDLRKGMSGADVKALQDKLNLFKYSPSRLWPNGKILSDGKYGDITEARVRDVQRRNGLDVDGWVGPKTRKFLGL